MKSKVVQISLFLILAIVGAVIALKARGDKPSTEVAQNNEREDKAAGKRIETGLLSRTVEVGGKAYDYQVYVPAQAQENENLPAVLFLHGIGQRGEGGFIPTSGDVASFAKSYLERVPAIVVLPQCRKDRYWPHEDMAQMAIAALDTAVTEFGGDRKRLYLVGASMGGYGAWHLAAEYPGKFAAVVPICGGSPLRAKDRFTLVVEKIGHTPVWAFHGADDRIVPVSESRNMVKALKAINPNVRYSEYKGVGHAVWLNIMVEPELVPWMFSQRVSD